MLGSTDLKLEMACCWKTVWSVDPLPLSVPLRLVLLLADADVLLLAVDDEVLLLDGELDEEHAARASAVATKAAPAVMTRCLRPRCIIRYPSYVSRPR